MDDHHPVRYVDRHVGEKPWQRTAAVAALVLGAAGLVLLVWFGFDNLGYLLVLLAGAALLLFAGFAALTSTGAMRLMALVTAFVGVGVLVTATAVRFASLGEVRGTGLGALACLVVAVLCGRYALRVPPPSGDAVWAVHSRADHPARGRHRQPGIRWGQGRVVGARGGRPPARHRGRGDA